MNAESIISLDILKNHFYRYPGTEISATLPYSDSAVTLIKEDVDNIPTIGHTIDSTDKSSFDDESKTILEDFKMFATGRPEYAVISKHWLVDKVKYYRTHTIDAQTLADMRETYITLLQGCALLRAKQRGVYDTGKVLTQLAKVLNWLDGTDFYSAPASTKWHESFKGGLIFHSLTVAARIIEIADVSVYRGKINIEDAVLCALVHDWCKINKYEQYMKNQKNEETNQWEKVPAYKYREEIMVPLGHGETSMYIAMKMFNLSQEEAVAIRNHMGKWAADNSYNVTDLQYANENYPLNLLLQFADQLACVKF